VSDPGQSLEIVRRPDYPRLGWAVGLGEGRPTAHCGEDVETFGRGLVEGCWAGPFREYGFAGRADLFGSGVAADRDGTWWFCPPCHTLDALYALARPDGRVHVANSLVLLLERTGVRLDPAVHYTRAIATLVSGLDKAETLLWRGEGFTLHRVLFDDFTFERGGRLARRRKVEHASFPAFADYRDHLLRVVGACAENAADPARRRAYGLVSTCSSGYDSNTGAALAAALGGRLALTIRSARGGAVDTGRPAAEALGMRCVEREQEGRGLGGREVEFLTPGTGGADSPLAVFEPELGGALLLTGYHGDKVWERTVPPTAVLKRGDPSGASLTDFRLRVGFLHLPVPFVGALKHAEIHAISNAPEMAPYSVGGGYDRPICRRILEEAGVPRELVGQAKHAVAMIYSWSPRQLSPEVRAGLLAFLRERGLLARVRAELAAFQAAAVGFRAIRKATKLAPGLLERPLGGLRDRLDRRFRAYENSSYANLLFVWAVERALELRAAARAAGSGPPRRGRAEPGGLAAERVAVAAHQGPAQGDREELHPAR
jgi:hypothetical protein